MPWTIHYSKQAERQLKKLGPEIERRIRTFMAGRIAPLEKPQVAAKLLTGPYESLLRYRVGDYRVVCEIHDHVLVILVVAVAHRREVYRGTEI